MSYESQKSLNKIKCQTLLPSIISKSKTVALSSWSSNINSSKSCFASNENFYDFEDKKNSTTQMSDKRFDSLRSDDTRSTIRPSTSVSLPSKVKENQNLLGDRVKNPSCPIMLPKPAVSSQIPSNPRHIIKVQSLSSDKTQHSNEEAINSDLSPISIVLNSSTTNSNLEYFINLASNPFTTKFEIIGPKQASGSNHLKNTFSSEPKSNLKNSSSTNLINKKAYYSGLNEMTDDFYCRAKSISDENLDTEYIYQTNTRLNTNFTQLTDKIFTGDITSLRNERKMCKFNIEYLIDMSGMRPEELNSKQLLGKLACLCNLAHSRTTLSVQLIDKSFKNLFIAFSEVNKLIHLAKKSVKNKCVLIFGKENLSSPVVCACAQYLMVDYQMDMKTALNVILGRQYSYVDLNFDQELKNYLVQLETYLKHLAANIQFENLPNKSNKAKFVYNTFTNEEAEDEKSSVQFDNIDKSNLDYCNISDEDNDYGDVQYKNRNKYIAETDSNKLLINSSREYKQNSFAFNKLKKSENSSKNGPDSNANFKMAWM